jgi:hypothetical protein
VGNLYINLEGYFQLSSVMVEIGNLDANLRGYFMYFFIMAKVGNFNKFSRSNG